MPEIVGQKLPEDWVEKPEAPPSYKDFSLRLKGFEQWKFRLRIPSLPEYTRLMKKMSKIAQLGGKSGEDAGTEFLERIDEYIPTLAELGAQLTVMWNFLDQDGNPLPPPNGDPSVLNKLRSDVAWDYLMIIAEFAGTLQAGGMNEEAAKKF